MIFNNGSSQNPRAIAQNSASALDFATPIYFSLFQVTRFPPRKVQYLVDLLLTIDST